MSIMSDLRSLTPKQRSAVVASYLGWTLDAFDFFIMTFVLTDIAKEFNTEVPAVVEGLFLTLAMRPVGALLFGLAADKFGRRPTLMVDVLLYSAVEFASGFAPSLTVLLILRAIYGVAMGGEWGVGASLTMETIPAKTRGIISGLLQAGYPSGYLLAGVAYGLLFDHIGWRGMFMVGAAPALLVLYIRSQVEESPAFTARQHVVKRPGIWSVVKNHVGLLVYAVLLMAAFNSFSHGSQDLYPTFLKVEHKFDTTTVSILTVVLNVGAIIGGIGFGLLSEHIGRRWAIIIAALLALPVIPLWAFSTTPVMLGLGAFLMQVAVQGAWGVVPVYLNEISPEAIRGTFPGVVYQLGNLLASKNQVLQAQYAKNNGDAYGFIMAVVIAIVALAIAILTFFGRESRGTVFAHQDSKLPASE
ncbi:MAG TPA: MFS transporter [Dongiaceae bacterium]|nr:MFS transporter [Dongiaceae bacterium]